jgi:hypothetical protein
MTFQIWYLGFVSSFVIRISNLGSAVASTPLYLEVDEDITSAIDKLLKAKGDHVQVVVPKRSTLLTSLINLKLLKKAAADAKKDLVLVTTDRTAVNLAAQLQIAVADNLKSQPDVPAAPVPEPDGSDEIVEEEAEALSQTEDPRLRQEDGPEMKAVVTHKPVEGVPAAPVAEAAGARARSPKVPDFNRLQRRLLIGGGAVAAILVFGAVNFVIKTAHLTVYAKGAKIATNFAFTVDTKVKESDIKHQILAGQQLSADRTLSETFTATGKKDVGTKASGTVTVTNYCFNPGTLPAGTSFTSSNGLKFVSTQSVAVPDKALSAGVCVNPPTAAVPVEASANGDNYNLAPTTYSVNGYSQAQVKGTGDQMSGGTSKVVTVVSQADVNKTKENALAKDKEDAGKDLAKQGNDELYLLADSLAQKVNSVTPSPAVGEEANQATLTISLTDTELAVTKSDLAALLDAAQADQVGEANQVYDNGLNNAKITVGNKPTEFSLSTDAYAGAKLEPAKLAKLVSGKKYGDAIDALTKQPGVDKVELSLWPFWVTRLPRIISHIKLEIKVNPA